MEQTGVYSNQQIFKAIEAGQIVFHPFNKDQINGASIDITLGEWYYKVEDDKLSNFYNPFSKEEVEKYFSQPLKAIEHEVWAKKAKRLLIKNIPANHPIIVLDPGERILTHSHEFIGIHPQGCSAMQARSTWGRNGVAVCIDAGWGDPGYINRWTMEVYNLNKHHSIALPVGERLAQIVFYHTGGVTSQYDKLSGKYQNSGDLKKIIADWQPSSMLPKAYKDKRFLPRQV